MYFRLLILRSSGFSASAGIAQYDPIFAAPGIRPSAQRTCILLTVIPHFSDVCFIDKYSIILSPVKPIYILHPPTIVYSKLRIKSIRIYKKKQDLGLNCTPFVRQYDILFSKWGDFYAKRSTKQTIYSRI